MKNTKLSITQRFHQNINNVFQDIREFGFLARIKQSIHNNHYNTKGSMKDLKSYEQLTMNRIENNIDNICNKFKSLPDQHNLGTLIKNNTNVYYSIQARYFNPSFNYMMEILPNKVLDPIMGYNFFYMRELLALKNITPMSYAELKEHSRLWHVFNRASADLHESLKKK